MRINSQNAREFAAKSAAARRLKRQNEELAKLNPPAIPLLPTPETEDNYRQARLVRVRQQLARIDTMIEEELDPAKLDRLAGASSKLSEQERQLSNRPMPPTVRTAIVRRKENLLPPCYREMPEPDEPEAGPAMN